MQSYYGKLFMYILVVYLNSRREVVLFYGKHLDWVLQKEL